MSDYRTPLSRVRHLGSARNGTHHWWMQRLTAIALVPLTIWFTIAIVKLIGADYVTVKLWMAKPYSMIMLILTMVMTFHHGQLGLQAVVEDYLHVEWQKLTAIIFVKFTAIVLALTGIIAVLRVGLGG